VPQGGLELPIGDSSSDVSDVPSLPGDTIDTVDSSWDSAETSDLSSETGHPNLEDSDGDGVPDVDDEAPTDPDWPGLAQFGYIYAHTDVGLYQWKPSGGAPTQIGPFCWPDDGGMHMMTDIAITREGVLFGIAFDGLYRCSAVSAACKTLAMMTSDTEFNGLTIIPKGVIDTDHETMVAIAVSGGWYKVEVSDDVATLTQLGSYGSAYSSAGDSYSIESVGTFAAVDKSSSLHSGTLLVKVNPQTGAVMQEIGWVTGDTVWGLAGLGSQIYAFDASGAIYGGDVDTGAFSLVVPASEGAEWWGAGVSTRLKAP